jgi:hypothetical protein
MNLVLGSVVDTDALLQTVLAALVAGLGVTLIFSIAIFAFARFAELGREERPVPAFAYAVVALAAAVAFLGAIAVGIVVMTSK